MLKLLLFVASTNYLCGVVHSGELRQSDSEDAYSRLLDQYTTMSLRAVYTLMEENPYSTVVTSVFPAINNLGALALHTDGCQEDELLKSLNLRSRNEIRESFKKLKEFNSRVSMKMYASCDHPLNEKFVNAYSSIFKGQVGCVDYKVKEKAVREINQWANNQTSKKGEDLQIVTPEMLCDERSLLAVSTNQFLVDWDEKPSFKVMDFQISENETIHVATLYGERKIKYADVKDLNAEFIDLPLNEECTVRLLASKTVDGLPELMKKLQSRYLYNEAAAHMKERNVIIKVPLGEVLQQSDLKKILQQEFKNLHIFSHKSIGLNTIFRDNEDAYICNMVHRTNLIGSKDLLGGKPASHATTTTTSTTSTVTTTTAANAIGYSTTNATGFATANTTGSATANTNANSNTNRISKSYGTVSVKARANATSNSTGTATVTATATAKANTTSNSIGTAAATATSTAKVNATSKSTVTTKVTTSNVTSNSTGVTTKSVKTKATANVTTSINDFKKRTTPKDTHTPHHMHFPTVPPAIDTAQHKCGYQTPEVRVKYPFVYIIICKGIISLIGTYYGNA